MGTVGIKEAAAVGAPLLDELLRCDRPLRDQLPGWSTSLRIDKLCGVVRAEVLNYSLRHQQQRSDQAKRQQHPKRRARHVNPEVSDGLTLLSCDAANKRNCQCDADRGRNEVVICESRHLREVAHGGLGYVRLPVSIGRKGCGGIKRRAEITS